MLPTTLYKHVVICGALPRNNTITLTERISKARNDFSTFGFLEWAERFLPDYTRYHKYSDIRLMTTDELNEYQCCNPQLKVM